MSEEEMFIHTPEQIEIINEKLKKARRDVPTFMDEGAAEIIYCPIDDGELKIYHHIPENSETKRPIVFVPGFVAAPSTWVDFHYLIMDLVNTIMLKLERNNLVK